MDYEREEQEQHREIYEILVKAQAVPVCDDIEGKRLRWFVAGEDKTKEITRQLGALVDWVEILEPGNPAKVNIWSSDIDTTGGSCEEFGIPVVFDRGWTPNRISETLEIGKPETRKPKNRHARECSS